MGSLIPDSDLPPDVTVVVEEFDPLTDPGGKPPSRFDTVVLVVAGG